MWVSLPSLPLVKYVKYLCWFEREKEGGIEREREREREGLRERGQRLVKEHVGVNF